MKAILKFTDIPSSCGLCPCSHRVEINIDEVHIYCHVADEAYDECPTIGRRHDCQIEAVNAHDALVNRINDLESCLKSCAHELFLASTNEGFKYLNDTADKAFQLLKKE